MPHVYVKVEELTADQALVIYRRMGPDLRLLLNGTMEYSMPVGWAFQPENSLVLTNAMRHFLTASGIRVVKVFKNDFDLLDPVMDHEEFVAAMRRTDFSC
jgi:hypothetical protein